jgi:hypothetical protein
MVESSKMKSNITIPKSYWEYWIVWLVHLHCPFAFEIFTSWGIDYEHTFCARIAFLWWKRYCHRPTSCLKCRMSEDALWVGMGTRYSDSLLAGRSAERIPVGARFSAPIQTDSEAHPASYTISAGSFPGVKKPGRGGDHPPLSSANVKERVDLYLYSPFGVRGLF